MWIFPSFPTKLGDLPFPLHGKRLDVDSQDLNFKKTVPSEREAQRRLGPIF